jgi:cyclic pyranopterin phosphate synthase
MDFTHFDKKGDLDMVDIGDKPFTERVAIAKGYISLSEKTVDLIERSNIKKGNVYEISRISGILAVKKVSDLIPLTHPLPIEKIKIEFFTEKERINCFSFVKTHYKTGVEMEALFAVSSSLMTVYDMVKAVDKEGIIEGIELIYKSGGKSGLFYKERDNIKIIKEKGKNHLFFKEKKIFTDF